MFYWLVLITVVGLSFSLKKDSIFYLKIAFYIFIAGVVIRIIGLVGISEIFMRISFIYWIVGLTIAIKKLN